MRIGIDGRLLEKLVSGIPRYAQAITAELLKKPGEFSILTAHGVYESIYKSTPNITAIHAHRQWPKSQILRELLFQAHTARWLQKSKIDLIWSPNHRLPVLIPKEVARVITIHDLAWHFVPETMKPLNRVRDQVFVRQLIKRSDIVVAVSESTAHAISDVFPEGRERIRIVYEGVTQLPRPQDPSALAPLGINQPYLLAVGTIEPRKNYERLLTAFSKVDRSIRGRTQLVFVGADGWGSVDLPSLVKSLGLESDVILVGHVDDHTLATLYENALSLMMPSLYEGFGLPIIEAMSFGTPVLTSDNSSMPEIAGPGGLLINPHSSDSIAEGIKTLFDTELLQALSDQARVRAKYFTWERTATQLWDIFHEARELAAVRIRG